MSGTARRRQPLKKAQPKAASRLADKHSRVILRYVGTGYFYRSPNSLVSDPWMAANLETFKNAARTAARSRWRHLEIAVLDAEGKVARVLPLASRG